MPIDCWAVSLAPLRIHTLTDRTRSPFQTRSHWVAGQGDGQWQGRRLGRKLVTLREVAVSEMAQQAEVVEPGPKAAAGND